VAGFFSELLIKFLDAAERAAVLIVDDLKGLQPQD
jgi:hypothetical protein